MSVLSRVLKCWRLVVSFLCIEHSVSSSIESSWNLAAVLITQAHCYGGHALCNVHFTGFFAEINAAWQRSLPDAEKLLEKAA